MASFSSLVDSSGKHLRAWSVILLFAFFAASGVTNYFSGVSDPSPKTCEARTPKEASNQDKAGTLRIVDVVPKRTAIDRRVCVIVAGVVSEEFENRNANRIRKLKETRDAALVAQA